VRVKLQPAFVLHARPYRDTSQILDVLTPEYGRLALVAKGSRRRVRGGSTVALLQPFVPLLLSFSGRGEMKTLTGVEIAGPAKAPVGTRLYSGFYLNELLVRLMHRHDPHPILFSVYSETVKSLAGDGQVDEALRRFEFNLLRELGFGFELALDGVSGQAVVAEHWYRFDTECGLVCVDGNEHADVPAFPGNELLAMAGGEFGQAVRSTAKRLLRQALASHLGDKPLKSRELFLRRRYDQPQGASPGQIKGAGQ